VAVTRAVGAVLVAKTVRTYCYGFLGILLPVYLTDLGVDAEGVGSTVTLTLVGSALLTWAVRRPAERLGGRTALLALAGLSMVAAVLLLTSQHPWVVIAAAMLGNVAVGTGETGPFLTLEQVVLARAVAPTQRTLVLSVYNLAGYGAAALGALTVVAVPYATLFLVFLIAGALQAIAYAQLSRTPARTPATLASLPSAPLIRRLAALFALDAFAGGFVLQSLIVYFLHVRHGLGLDQLGWVFFAAQILTAASLLLAAGLARRFGLLNTMVVSHFVSNFFLMAVAGAPTATAAIALLLARQLTSQMDVPTRQAYVMAVVRDHEREAAAVITTLARTVAQAITPALTGWIMQASSLGTPFLLGGGLKILYDILIYLALRNVPLPDDPT
jgi:MFS family permease